MTVKKAKISVFFEGEPLYFDLKELSTYSRQLLYLRNPI